MELVFLSSELAVMERKRNQKDAQRLPKYGTMTHIDSMNTLMIKPQRVPTKSYL